MLKDKTNEEVNLAKMRRLMSLMDEKSLTTEDFKEAFKKVIEHIKKIDARNLVEIKTMKEALNKLGANIDTRASSNIEMSKKEAIAFMKKELGSMSLKQSEVAKMIDKKLAQVQNGLDGKDADQESMIEEVLERVLEPVLKKTSDNLPQLGNSVRNALELLTDDDRLDVESIKGLDKLIEEIKKELRVEIQSSRALGAGGSGAGKFNVAYYDLSDSLDGATKTFSLPAFHKVLDVKLSSVPVLQQNTDYTIDGSNNKITFTSEITLNDLSEGQVCTILYSEN